MNSIKKILVVGYPRTAERFLSHNYESVTKTRSSISHNIEDLSRLDRTVLTVMRDPLDTISSAIAIGLWQRGNSFNKIAYTGILKMSTNYLEFYEKAFETDTVLFVDFNDIVSRPLKTIQTLASTIGHKSVSNKIFSQKEIQDISPESAKYLATSKNLETYQEAREALIKYHDLSSQYGIFNKCLDRCIIIPSDE